MGITTTGSMARSTAMGSKIRCWDCDKEADAFLIESHSGNQICGACASAKGEILVIEPSSDPIGTIEKGKKRAR